MKFIHIADMHFDSPFTSLKEKENLGNIRRLEQREVFKKAIEYIKENKISYLFIAGDLYEHEYIKQSTIEYINHLFKSIPDTKIYIAPGNHDPFLRNSYYTRFDWNENVHIFNSYIEKVTSDIGNIYGYGFSDFHCFDSEIENIKLEEPEKVNILITHGMLAGGGLGGVTEQDKGYNPISSQKLKSIGFDYVAMGHIHKPSDREEGNQKIIYPGSMISFGFDELGSHGMIVGEIEKGKIETKFISLDPRQFVEKEIKMDPIFSKEELIEILNELKIQENTLCKIVLVGRKNFEVDRYEIYPLLQNRQIIKIKDKSKKNIDIEKLANEENVKGLFIRQLLEKMNEEQSDEKKEIIQKAIEIGLDALEG